VPGRVGKSQEADTLIAVESTDRFAILMGGDERYIAPDEAAFVLASHFHEGLVVEDGLAELDALAEGCGSSLADVLEHVFSVLGFRGNTGGYYDQDNSCLDAVIDRRLGIPITLSIILMSVGRRVGREMSGIGMPGHFLTLDLETGTYLDAFDRGQQLDEFGCQQLFMQLHGSDAPWHQSMLAPIGTRGIIRRMLNNLAQIAAGENDHRSRIIATRLRSLLPDATIWERAELARAYEASGDFDRASCVLEAVAAEAPDEEAKGFRFAAAGLRALLN
jgi:regulator of sirC expression with transglutaminase-like and TPR domain